MNPDQTAPRGAVWSGSTLFATMTFNKSNWQKTKQMTIVEFGILRVNSRNLCISLDTAIYITGKYNQKPFLILVIIMSSLQVRRGIHINFFLFL